MVLAAAATRGHKSAHSFATGPVIAEPVVEEGHVRHDDDARHDNEHDDVCT